MNAWDQMKKTLAFPAKLELTRHKSGTIQQELQLCNQSQTGIGPNYSSQRI